MSPVEYRPVTDVDFRAFTSAFNLAYSDYTIPISMTVSSFRSLIERDDLSLEDSVAAVEAGQIIGTGLLGIRGRVGWIGGMGVVPAYRRHGVGRQMMLYLLQRARENDLSHIDLEVIEHNQGAYALYRKLGFEDVRYLISVERPPGPLSPVETLPPDLTIREQPASALLRHYTAFHETENSWQRSLRSLELLIPHVEGWAVHVGDCLAGYALGWASRHGIQLVDFALHPESDRENLAAALLASLHRMHPDAPGNMYNIPENDPVLAAYRRLGYSTTLRQIEMRLPLS